MSGETPGVCTINIYSVRNKFRVLGSALLNRQSGKIKELKIMNWPSLSVDASSNATFLLRCACP